MLIRPSWLVYLFCFVCCDGDIAILGAGGRRKGIDDALLKSLSFGINTSKKITALNGSGISIQTELFEMRNLDESLKISPSRLEYNAGNLLWESSYYGKSWTLSLNRVPLLKVFKADTTPHINSIEVAGHGLFQDILITQNKQLDKLMVSLCSINFPSDQAKSSTCVSNVATQKGSITSIFDIVTNTINYLSKLLQKYQEDNLIMFVQLPKMSDLLIVNKTLDILKTNISSNHLFLLNLIEEFNKTQSNAQNSLNITISNLNQTITTMSHNLVSNISTLNQTLLTNINNRTFQLDTRINDTIKIFNSNLTQIQHTTNTLLNNITNILLPSLQKENEKQILSIYDNIHTGLQTASKNISQIYNETNANFTTHTILFHTLINTTNTNLTKQITELATNHSITYTLLKYEFNTSLEKLQNKMELEHTLLTNNNINNNISTSKSLIEIFQNITSLNNSLISFQLNTSSNLITLNATLTNHTNSLLANITENKDLMNQLFINTTKVINSTENKIRDELHEFQNNASSAIARSNAIISKVIADINVTITTTNDEIFKNISDLTIKMEKQLQSLSDKSYNNLTDSFTNLTATVTGNKDTLNNSILSLAVVTWGNMTTMQLETMKLISNTSNAIAEEGNARRLSHDTLTSQLHDNSEVFQNITSQLRHDITVNLTALQQITTQSILDTNTSLSTAIFTLSNLTNHTTSLLSHNISNLSFSIHEVNKSITNSLNDSITILRTNLTSSLITLSNNTNHTINTLNTTLLNTINQTIDSFQRAHNELWNKTEYAINNSHVLRDQLQLQLLTRIDSDYKEVNNTLNKLENTTHHSMLKLNESFSELLHQLNDSTQTSFYTISLTVNASLQSLLEADKKIQEEYKKELTDLKYDLVTLEVMSYNNIQQVANQSVTTIRAVENSTNNNISILNHQLLDLINTNKNLSEVTDNQLALSLNKTIENLNATNSLLLLTNTTLLALLTSYQNKTAFNITSLMSQINDNYNSTRISLLELKDDINTTDTSIIRDLKSINTSIENYNTNTSKSLTEINSTLTSVNTSLNDLRNKMIVDQTIMKQGIFQTISDTNNTFNNKLVSINKTFTDIIAVDKVQSEAKIHSTQSLLEGKIMSLNSSLLSLNHSFENKLSSLQNDLTHQREAIKVDLEKELKDRLLVESILTQNILELRSDLGNTSKALQHMNTSLYQLSSENYRNLTQVNNSLWEHIQHNDKNNNKEISAIQTNQATTSNRVDRLEQSSVVIANNITSIKSDLNAVTEKVLQHASNQHTLKENLTYLTFNVTLLSKDLSQLTTAQSKTESEISSLLKSDLPLLKVEIMKLTERQEAVNTLSDSRYNSSQQANKLCESEKNNLLTNILQITSNVTEKITNTITAQNQSNLELSVFKASTKEELRKVESEITSLNSKQIAEKTALEGLGKQLNSSTSLFLSLKSDVEVVHAVKESVSHLKESFSQQISELKEKQLNSEKLLSELSGRVHLLELNGIALEKRLSLLEGERERGMREYATSTDVESVRKLVNELQMNMLVHSGKVLDLVTAAHLAPSKANP